MKYLVDTCDWIEWLVGSQLLGKFEKYLNHPQHLITPTIVQFELYKWICRERDEEMALEIIGITEQTRIIPLDTSLSLFAADMAKQYQLTTADSIVYATARKHRVQLISCDKHFKSLPNVVYFPK